MYSPEYRVADVSHASTRGRQGFAAKLVTTDFNGDEYDIAFFPDADEAEIVCVTLNDAVAECERLLLGVD